MRALRTDPYQRGISSCRHWPGVCKEQGLVTTMATEGRVRGIVGALARLTLNWLLLVIVMMSLETVASPAHHLRWDSATASDSLHHDLDLARECLELTGNADCTTPDLPREVPEG
jgi:hypothetical protein